MNSSFQLIQCCLLLFHCCFQSVMLFIVIKKIHEFGCISESDRLDKYLGILLVVMWNGNTKIRYVASSRGTR